MLKEARKIEIASITGRAKERTDSALLITEVDLIEHVPAIIFIEVLPPLGVLGCPATNVVKIGARIAIPGFQMQDQVLERGKGIITARALEVSIMVNDHVLVPLATSLPRYGMHARMETYLVASVCTAKVTMAFRADILTVNLTVVRPTVFPKDAIPSVAAVAYNATT